MLWQKLIGVEAHQSETPRVCVLFDLYLSF